MAEPDSLRSELAQHAAQAVTLTTVAVTVTATAVGLSFRVSGPEAVLVALFPLLIIHPLARLTLNRCLHTVHIATYLQVFAEEEAPYEQRIRRWRTMQAAAMQTRDTSGPLSWRDWHWNEAIADAYLLSTVLSIVGAFIRLFVCRDTDSSSWYAMNSLLLEPVFEPVRRWCASLSSWIVPTCMASPFIVSGLFAKWRILPVVKKLREAGMDSPAERESRRLWWRVRNGWP
jgi:hypothetical protein